MKQNLINAFVTITTIAVSGAAFQLAMRGDVSWWFYGAVIFWGLTLGMSAFYAGWDARGDDQ